MIRSDRTVGGKAWTQVLAAWVFAIAALPVFAGFTRTGTISTSVRKQLNDQTVYTVSVNNLTVSGSSGMSALYLAPNTTAVLYIPTNITLKVKGGSANSGTKGCGAGAGIEIPLSSTLIITGGGRLEAIGGAGSSGAPV